MSVAEARAYHMAQIEDFAHTEADMVAFTMNYIEEAIGIALAAKAAGMPVAISFTTEIDGRLPAGETLDQAIERTDAASNGYPAYYMINCAHPTHLENALARKGTWRDRIGGLRGNASKRKGLSSSSRAKRETCSTATETGRAGPSAALAPSG